jgi:hypothetical protein
LSATEDSGRSHRAALTLRNFDLPVLVSYSISITSVPLSFASGRYRRSLYTAKIHSCERILKNRHIMKGQ